MSKKRERRNQILITRPTQKYSLHPKWSQSVSTFIFKIKTHKSNEVNRNDNNKKITQKIVCFEILFFCQLLGFFLSLDVIYWNQLKTLYSLDYLLMLLLCMGGVRTNRNTFKCGFCMYIWFSLTFGNCSRRMNLITHSLTMAHVHKRHQIQVSQWTKAKQQLTTVMRIVGYYKNWRYLFSLSK